MKLQGRKYKYCGVQQGGAATEHTLVDRVISPYYHSEALDVLDLLVLGIVKLELFFFKKKISFRSIDRCLNRERLGQCNM